MAGDAADIAMRASKALARERAALAHFISRELGHARSFSLDTDAAVRDRAVSYEHSRDGDLVTVIGPG